jgi:anti-sigma factor RsiW
MNENIGIQEVNAFVDGELELSRHLEIERAAKLDARLAAQLDATRSLRNQVRSEGDYHAAPDDLRKRLAAMGRTSNGSPSAVAPSAVTGVGAALQRWWGWRPLSAAFAATFALSLGVQTYLGHESRETRLADEVVASHVRSTLGEHLIDVASSDHHTVKPFLSSKLDFSPPVRDAQIGSATFLGGRVDYLDGRPVAALVYRQGQHLVNTFIWPSSSGDSQAAFSSDRGYQIAHWNRDGMTHWIISDVNRVEFVNFVNMIASPPDTTPAGNQ